MIIPATLLIGIGLTINVADTAPRYDMKPPCRAAIALAAGSEGRNIENCMAGEEEARRQIDKEWSKTPSAERSQCIGTVAVGGSPSYVELVVCLEMMRDSRTHRDEKRTNNAQKSTSKKP
ncbi:MAG: hypothetical protein WAM77_05215 [Xanthobacteraceae bacterium]|jgi:hypothetical protein